MDDGFRFAHGCPAVSAFDERPARGRPGHPLRVWFRSSPASVFSRARCRIPNVPPWRMLSRSPRVSSAVSFTESSSLTWGNAGARVPVLLFELTAVGCGAPPHLARIRHGSGTAPAWLRHGVSDSGRDGWARRLAVAGRCRWAFGPVGQGRRHPDPPGAHRLSSVNGPELVGLAVGVAVPDLQARAVGGALSGGVETLAGVGVDEIAGGGH